MPPIYEVAVKAYHVYRVNSDDQEQAIDDVIYDLRNLDLGSSVETVEVTTELDYSVER